MQSDTLLARSIDEITPQWVTAALRVAGALGTASVQELEVDQVGTGQMGDVFRLTPIYDGDATPAPKTLVCKLAATDDQSRNAGLATRAYEVEVNFYRSLRDTVDVFTPRVFAAEVDTETGWFTLLLEDLAPRQQGDQIRGCSVERVAVGLHELALLHAPRWADNGLGSLEWLNRFQPEPVEAILGALYPGFVDRYGPRLGDDALGTLGESVARIGDYLRSLAEPYTIHHYDFRLDNMLFDPDDETARVGIVDWQTVGFGEPMLDAAYFVAGSLGVDDRRRSERDLLATYHEALVANGVPGYSWDRCWHDYRRNALHGVVMVVIPAMLVQQTDRGDEMFVTTLHRYLAQISDLEATKELS